MAGCGFGRTRRAVRWYLGLFVMQELPLFATCSRAEEPGQPSGEDSALLPLPLPGLGCCLPRPLSPSVPRAQGGAGAGDALLSDSMASYENYTTL